MTGYKHKQGLNQVLVCPISFSFSGSVRLLSLHCCPIFQTAYWTRFQHSHNHSAWGVPIHTFTGHRRYPLYLHNRLLNHLLRPRNKASLTMWPSLHLPLPWNLPVRHPSFQRWLLMPRNRTRNISTLLSLPSPHRIHIQETRIKPCLQECGRAFQHTHTCLQAPPKMLRHS